MHVLRIKPGLKARMKKRVFQVLTACALPLTILLPAHAGREGDRDNSCKASPQIAPLPEQTINAYRELISELAESSHSSRSSHSSDVSPILPSIKDDKRKELLEKLWELKEKDFIDEGDEKRVLEAKGVEEPSELIEHYRALKKQIRLHFLNARKDWSQEQLSSELARTKENRKRLHDLRKDLKEAYKNRRKPENVHLSKDPEKRDRQLKQLQRVADERERLLNQLRQIAVKELLESGRLNRLDEALKGNQKAEENQRKNLDWFLKIVNDEKLGAILAEHSVDEELQRELQSPEEHAEAIKKYRKKMEDKLAALGKLDKPLISRLMIIEWNEQYERLSLADLLAEINAKKHPEKAHEQSYVKRRHAYLMNQLWELLKKPEGSQWKEPYDALPPEELDKVIRRLASEHEQPNGL